MYVLIYSPVYFFKQKGESKQSEKRNLAFYRRIYLVISTLINMYEFKKEIEQ